MLDVSRRLAMLFALMICRAMILLIGFVPVKVYSVMICPAMTLCVML